MFDLPHVASRVFGTPLMIARAKLEVILGVLAPRFAGGPVEPVDPTTDPAPLTSVTVERIAVVSVIGTLVSRSGYLDATSGLLSYGDIADAIASAMDDPSVRGVILDVDSPGGEVGGLFDLAERIGAIKAASDKPLWAVANESALSAAYAIASTADRLYVTRTGEVGSIGVVAVHVDESGADAKAGLSWSFVFAGEQKIDGNAHEPLSERARDTIQADVDQLYAELCGLVATNRGLTVETVRGTNAAVYRGELAVRAGLADRVGTLDVAIADMASEFDQAAMPARNIINPTIRRGARPWRRTRSNGMSTMQASRNGRFVAGGAVRATARTGFRTPPSACTYPSAGACSPRPNLFPNPIRPNGCAQEYAEIAGLAAQAIRLGVTVDAADAMRRGVSRPILRRSVLDTLVARAEATSVIAAAPSTPVAGDSPIVRRAKERAAAAARA